MRALWSNRHDGRSVSRRRIECYERRLAIHPHALALPETRLHPEQRASIVEGQDATTPGEDRQRQIPIREGIAADENTWIEPPLLDEAIPPTAPLTQRARATGSHKGGDNLVACAQLIAPLQPLRLLPAQFFVTDLVERPHLLPPVSSSLQHVKLA